MNAWDIATWLAATALAASAVGIFGFFLRDARSILTREMHGNEDEEADNSAAPDTTPATPPPASPENLPR